MKDIHSATLPTTSDNDNLRNEIISSSNQYNNFIDCKALRNNKSYAVNKNMQNIHDNSVKAFTYSTPDSGEVSFFHNTINERHIFGKLGQSFTQNKEIKTSKENALTEKWVPCNKAQTINSKLYPFSMSTMMKGKKSSGNCDQTSKLVGIPEKEAVQYNDLNYMKRNQNKGVFYFLLFV